MPKHDIFYSWQSDLPNSTNRRFIEDCLIKAIGDVRSDETLNLDVCLERDTQGVPGSPDIASTIFEKISRAGIFVGDISFINGADAARKTPNPNVLVELGYAASRLGWDRIICVFNEATGKIAELPFDIRSRRVLAYTLVEGGEKSESRKAMIGVLKSSIKEILYSPDQAESQALQRLLSDLAPQLITVLILANELEARQINPLFESMRDQFRAVSRRLREFAACETADKHSMSTELNELAAALDSATNQPMYLGAQKHFQGFVQQAVEKATAIKQARIDGLPLAEQSLTDVRRTLAENQRMLSQLASRAESIAEQGRVDELESISTTIGSSLLHIGYYRIDAIQPGLADKLQRIGRELHLVDTMRIHRDCDGGLAVRSIVERINRNASEMKDIVASLCSSHESN